MKIASQARLVMWLLLYPCTSPLWKGRKALPWWSLIANRASNPSCQFSWAYLILLAGLPLDPGGEWAYLICLVLLGWKSTNTRCGRPSSVGWEGFKTCCWVVLPVLGLPFSTFQSSPNCLLCLFWVFMVINGEKQGETSLCHLAWMRSLITNFHGKTKGLIKNQRLKVWEL